MNGVRYTLAIMLQYVYSVLSNPVKFKQWAHLFITRRWTMLSTIILSAQSARKSDIL